MKTKLLLTLVTLIAAHQLHAQMHHRIGVPHRDTSNAILHHSYNAARQTTLNQSRLIADTYYRYDGTAFVFSDSTTYMYTGTNGGDLKHLMKYDTSIEYAYNNNAYAISEAAIQTFDADDNIAVTDYPTWDAAAGVYVNDEQALYSYDGNHNMLTEIVQYWDVTNHVWSNNYKYIYTYKGNTIDTETDQQWDIAANTWVNEIQIIYSYTPNNSISNVLNRNWSNAAWANNLLRTYTYDTKNNIKTTLYQNWDYTNLSWTNSGQVTYTYDTANDMLTSLQESWLNGQRTNNTLTTYSNFVSQQPQTEIIQNWDKSSNVWVNNREYNYTYNTFGQETSEIRQSWDGSIWLPQQSDSKSRYYYETYTLSVKSISNSSGSAKIYPVPAHDMLHIDLTWDIPQDCKIVIYDAVGRVCKQWQVPTAAQYHTTIAVNDLAIGNYFIAITGDKGQIVQKLIVD